MVRKPDIDPNDYKFITLENKLQVLIVSDPTTDKSAACLDVHVGSIHDPEQLQGLAHFCEHLSFMVFKGVVYD
jgi:insulysin